MDFEFPALDVDQNCAGEPLLSQVCGLLIVPDGVPPPTDWTDRNDWWAVINNAATGNTAGRYISGIGSVDLPEKNVVRVAKGFDLITYRTYRASFEVLKLSDAQYNFLRSLQCNPTNYRFWIETVGGSIFGGPTGIAPIFTDAELPKLSGETDIEKAIITIDWRASCEPDRTNIPLIYTNTAVRRIFAQDGVAFSEGGVAFAP